MKKVFLFTLIISAMLMTACGDGATKKLVKEREKKTGDPNDYTFEITVNEISVAK